jgi:hypothetical protein
MQLLFRLNLPRDSEHYYSMLLNYMQEPQHTNSTNNSIGTLKIKIYFDEQKAVNYKTGEFIQQISVNLHISHFSCCDGRCTVILLYTIHTKHLFLQLTDHIPVAIFSSSFEKRPAGFL